jgi:hypothetical protein
LSNTLTGILLAASAGLNAYIPLLGLALADRATDSINLSKPFDVISSTAGIVVLLFLLTVDLVVDKIPRLDHLNDLISTALRPAAGMFLAMAVTDGKGEIDEVVAMMIGLFVAGTVHAYKSISRIKMATKSTGAGSPLVSLVEDGIAAMVTLVALALPWLGAAILPVAGCSLAWFYRVVPNSLGGRPSPVAAPITSGASQSTRSSVAPDIEENSRAQS